MTSSLLDVMKPAEPHEQGRFFGVVAGVVTNNQDPEKMARVRVKCDSISPDHESWWARIASPMAGSGRGVYFVPEVNDEVLVAFEHGDVRSAYVVGALWNGKDAPPANNDDGKNNIRVLHSRSGHLVRLDDTDGDEKIEVIDKTGGNKITIKSKDNSMTIECTGKMSFHAQQGIEIKSDTDIKIKAGTTMDIESSATMTIKGLTVNIN